MRRMGGKAEAKAIAAKAGVPVVPGYQATARAPRRSAREAKRIGYPVMIKAVAGGGGRGMRLVEREADFAAALESAQREAQGGLRRCARPAREGDRPPAPYRGAGVRRQPRQRRAPVRARLLAAAAQPEGDRGGARAGHVAGAARQDHRGCRRLRQGRALRGRRHGRVPGRGRRAFGRRALVLHRDEHAPAGRASGDRGDHRARPRGMAAARRLGREAAAGAGADQDVRPRHRGAAQRRGPGQGLPALHRARSSPSKRRRRRAARRCGGGGGLDRSRPSTIP